jgi:hypothetical protein
MVPDASKRPGPLVFGVDFGVRVSGDMQRARASRPRSDASLKLSRNPDMASLDALHVREHQGAGGLALGQLDLESAHLGPVVAATARAALWLRREQTTQLGLGFGVVAQFEQGQ